MSEQDNRWRTVLVGATLAGIGLAGWGTDQFLQWRYRSTETADEVHHTTTEDDVRVGLLRHRPEDGQGEPVILVHGLGANHYHMDLDEHFSIGRYLSRRGYDAWCIELRGRGISEVPDRSWNFDDYAKRDIPAAIDFILEKTGASRIHWVGHSMGGMLLYAVAGAIGYNDKIRSAVSIGGPFHGRRSGTDQPRVRFPFGPTMDGYLTIFVPVLEVLRRLRLPWPLVARWSSLSYSLLKEVIPEPLIHIALNPENIADRTLRCAAVRDVVRVEAGVLEQFLEWAVDRHWVDGTGRLDYRRGVSDITFPIRLVAGNQDKMVPVHNKQSGFKQISSEDKDFVVAGRQNGFKADYSHVDLVYGHHARDEIFPLIDGWLDRHPSG